MYAKARELTSTQEESVLGGENEKIDHTDIYSFDGCRV